jgi:putative addiction module component (TIGR02574 family)
MDTTTIREKLHSFIDTAEDEKVVELLSFVENEPEEKYDHWEDEEFVAEIKSRIDDYESGKDKGLSWEEVKAKARSEFKAKH